MLFFLYLKFQEKSIATQPVAEDPQMQTSVQQLFLSGIIDDDPKQPYLLNFFLNKTKETLLLK
ncbi:MAG: hypothetical protein C5B49_03990 [Bdellovibrio sp.]|nr:MAG: hypothetical protein C5B49_03990 [Bdellovibrio sp.]